MVKTKIIETTEKYDKDGKLVEKITREEASEDNADYVPFYSYPGERLVLPSEPACADFGSCARRTCGSANLGDATQQSISHNPDGSINVFAESAFVNGQAFGGDGGCGRKS